MKIPTFDVFSGRTLDKDAVWIENVEGLGEACGRMKLLAAEKPGAYFVFHASSHKILACVDTTSNAEPKENSQVASA